MNKKIFLYGPQTSGKTTRLMGIIKRDHGKDILTSGENKAQINNGREVCDITLRVPREWTTDTKHNLLRTIHNQLPIKHVLVDGAQFLRPIDLKELTTLIHKVDDQVTIIFAGCLYYVATKKSLAKMIPTSRFLMKWCDQTIPVNRQCDFCHRIATHFWVHNFKRLSPKKMMAIDPHLVCNVHYQKLMK